MLPPSPKDCPKKKSFHAHYTTFFCAENAWFQLDTATPWAYEVDRDALFPNGECGPDNPL
jgi:hypothetical protein